MFTDDGEGEVLQPADPATTGQIMRSNMSPLRRLLPSAAVFIAGVSIISCLAASPALTAPDAAGRLCPESTWRMYAAPEEAGWSAERLSVAETLCEEIGSAACMACYDGAVLFSWGDVARRYMCHSVRKSYLSALYGIYEGEGGIDLDKTLEELGIDDVPPLVEEEKRAGIRHLLKSRSGVFHAAAYETPKMKERRPKRGSVEPGQMWYYNNWDFNALCTIFERQTGKGIFEAFKARIAEPLRMEDFRLMDAYYHLEEQHSIHPAYPFRMSARDMARFGLLFLREGEWKGRSIVPREWIEESTTAYSQAPYWEGHGYGYMWWVNVDETDGKHGMYAALGYGGHMIAVLPDQDLVVVNRTNTYLGEEAGRDDLMRLVDAIVEARESSPKPDPMLVPLEAPKDTVEIDTTVRLDSYAASFDLEKEEIFAESIPYVMGDIIGHRVRLEPRGDRMLMTDDLGQRFFLIPRSKTVFLIEDMEVPVVFELDEEGRPVRIALEAGPAWRITGRRASG